MVAVVRSGVRGSVPVMSSPTRTYLQPHSKNIVEGHGVQECCDMHVERRNKILQVPSPSLPFSPTLSSPPIPLRTETPSIH